MIQNLLKVIAKNYSSVNIKKYFMARYSFKVLFSNLICQRRFLLLFILTLYVERKELTQIVNCELFEDVMDFWKIILNRE